MHFLFLISLMSELIFNLGIDNIVAFAKILTLFFLFHSGIVSYVFIDVVMHLNCFLKDFFI